MRELDERLGFGELIQQHLTDLRRGRNTQLPFADLLRQSVYSRLAGYEDLNDAERRSKDPTFRLIGSEKVRDRGAARTSRLQTFETEMLGEEENFAGEGSKKGGSVPEVCTKIPRMLWRKKSVDEKAKQLAPAIVEVARTVAPSIYEALNLDPERGKIVRTRRESEQTVSLAMELIYFSLHLLDRECFARHGTDERSMFMDLLMVEILDSLSLDELPEKERIITGRVFVKLANQAQREYAQFPQLRPEKDQAFGGTLIWEFSKKLRRIYSPSSEEAVVIPVNLVALEYVGSLYGLMKRVKL